MGIQESYAGGHMSPSPHLPAAVDPPILPRLPAVPLNAVTSPRRPGGSNLVRQFCQSPLPVAGRFVGALLLPRCTALVAARQSRGVSTETTARGSPE